MKKIFISIALITLCGCTSFSINHLKGIASGVYNYNGVPVTGNFTIDHWGCIGFNCQPVNMTELINANNSGSTVNSNK